MIFGSYIDGACNGDMLNRKLSLLGNLFNYLKLCLSHIIMGQSIDKARRKRESKNTKQETKRFSSFAVYRLRHSETKKKLLDSRIMFKRNMCETANQQYI